MHFFNPCIFLSTFYDALVLPTTLLPLCVIHTHIKAAGYRVWKRQRIRYGRRNLRFWLSLRMGTVLEV